MIVADEPLAEGPAPGSLRASTRSAARQAAGPYLATRLGMLFLAFTGAWTAQQTIVSSWSSYLERWNRWDAVLFVRIARYGYGGDPSLGHDSGLPSFFPGFPVLLNVLQRLIPSYTVTGLLASLVAGAFAATALVRLAALEGDPPSVGQRAVAYLFLAPSAVFLTAGYSEGTFLAFALWAWLAAREERWLAAGLLAGLSTTFRVTGVFLGCALIVQYAVVARGVRWAAVSLLTPFAVLGAYFGYLHARTGDWLAWTHAQEAGFGRHFEWPWTAFHTTYSSAISSGQGAEYRFSFLLEILSIALGLVLVSALVWLRRWGEAVYVGLSVVALATSTFFFSVNRASLLWWPLYLLVAKAGVRRQWVHWSYLAVTAPLCVSLALTFTSGRWAG